MKSEVVSFEVLSLKKKNPQKEARKSFGWQNDSVLKSDIILTQTYSM